MGVRSEERITTSVGALDRTAEMPLGSEAILCLSGFKVTYETGTVGGTKRRWNWATVKSLWIAVQLRETPIDSLDLLWV